MHSIFFERTTRKQELKPCVFTQSTTESKTVRFTEFPKRGDLYICLEYRRVIVPGEQEIALTIKSSTSRFAHYEPGTGCTYEVIMDLVWNEDYTYYSRKSINNHVCNLRKS